MSAEILSTAEQLTKTAFDKVNDRQGHSRSSVIGTAAIRQAVYHSLLVV